MTDVVDRLGEDWLEEAGETQDPVETLEVVAAPEAVEAQEPQKPESTQEVQQQAEPEEKFNPTLYKEMKEERRKRQEAEREREELRQQIAAQQARQPVLQAQAVPDAYEDPAGFAAYVQQQQAAIKWDASVEISKFKAETKYGEDKVKEAIAWAQQQAAVDPSLDHKIGRAQSPVEFVVQEYQQSRTLQSLAGKSPEDFARDYAISQGWIVAQPEPGSALQQQPSPSKTPPRSLASKPGNGGVSQVPQGADWSEVKFALDR